MNVAIDAVISDKTVGGEKFKADREFGKSMRAVVATVGDDQKNELSKKITKAISGIEEEIRGHLRCG